MRKKVITTLEHKNPIWFIFGLSGTGKSTISSYIAERHDWKHMEIDQWTEGIGNGLDIFNIRDAWNRFETTGNPDKLIQSIKDIYRTDGKAGAVVSFSSDFNIKENDMKKLNKVSEAFYLIGEKEECLQAFLKREKTIGRNLTKEHWMRHNNDLIETLSDDKTKAYKLSTFNKRNLHKSSAETYKDLKRTIRNRNLLFWIKDTFFSKKNSNPIASNTSSINSHG
jgi:shikimate kinase